MFEQQECEGFRAELQENGVGLIMFNRPDKLNAITTGTFRDLERVLLQLGDDTACGAIVIGGEGRAFCSGMDLQTSPMRQEGHVPIHGVHADLKGCVRAIVALREIPQPVIAAVQGHAVGAGFSIAAVADVRICAPDAKFLSPFLKIGMPIGDLGLSWMLPRLIGAGAASEVFYTGTALGAAEGHRLGLVQRVVDEPLPVAVELAATIATRSRLAVQMTKELLNASIGAGGLREHLELEMRSQVIGLMTEDHRNAVRAFNAKQPAASAGT